MSTAPLEFREPEPDQVVDVITSAIAKLAERLDLEHPLLIIAVYDGQAAVTTVGDVLRSQVVQVLRETADRIEACEDEVLLEGGVP